MVPSSHGVKCRTLGPAAQHSGLYLFYTLLFAPVGIAAANVEVEGTDVVATTLHALLELDAELQTKLDLAKLDHAKVAALMKLQVLLLDEVSMLDTDAWHAISSILSTIDHSRRPDAQGGDAFGSLHVILFGDVKQPVDGLDPQGIRAPGDAGHPPGKTTRQPAATCHFAPSFHRAPGCLPQLRLSDAPAE